MFDFSCVEQTIIAFCVGVILCKLFHTDIDFLIYTVAVYL